MRKALIAIALAAAAAPVQGAQATQDWPCIQVRQPRLSVGQMWSGPAPDAAAEALAREDAAVRALAEQLSQRRLAVEDAGPLLDAFGNDPQRLTALFLAVFDRIESERERLLAGIARYGGGQAALAAQIEARRARMAELEAAPDPDFDAIDAEEEMRDWDTRVFEERRQMLTAVCESPVLLEQRLFELARMIQSRL